MNALQRRWHGEGLNQGPESVPEVHFCADCAPCLDGIPVAHLHLLVHGPDMQWRSLGKVMIHEDQGSACVEHCLDLQSIDLHIKAHGGGTDP